MGEGVDEAFGRILALGPGDQVQHDFGVRGRLADGAVGDDLVAKGQAVGDVAVMGDGDAAHFQFGEQRLDVSQDRLAGGRIAHMAHGRLTGQFGKGRGIGEIVADKAESAFRMELGAVEADDARRFLSAMLERVQPERRQRRGFGMPQNAEHAALFAQRVAVKIE